MTPEQAAWKSLKLLIMTKEEWKSRELMDTIAMVESEFMVGSVGELLNSMEESFI